MRAAGLRGPGCRRAGYRTRPGCRMWVAHRTRPGCRMWVAHRMRAGCRRGCLRLRRRDSWGRSSIAPVRMWDLILPHHTSIPHDSKHSPRFSLRAPTATQRDPPQAQAGTPGPPRPRLNKTVRGPVSRPPHHPTNGRHVTACKTRSLRPPCPPGPSGAGACSTGS